MTSVVLAVSALRFALTGVVQLGGPPVWEVVAGVSGLALGVVALYAAMAFELEDVHHRAVLPLGRTGPARQGHGVRGRRAAERCRAGGRRATAAVSTPATTRNRLEQPARGC